MRNLARVAGIGTPLAIGGMLILAMTALGADPSPSPSSSGGSVPSQQVDWGLFLYVLLGVVISFAIPAARKAAGQAGSLTGIGSAVLQLLRPYLPWAVLSLAASVATMFLAHDSITGQVSAFVAGYSWDSTIQKFTGKP